MISHIEKHLYFKAQVHRWVRGLQNTLDFFQPMIYISEKFLIATVLNKLYLNLDTESDLSNEPRNLGDKSKTVGKA